MEAASHLFDVFTDCLVLYYLLELSLRQQLVIIAIDAINLELILPFLLRDADLLLDVGYCVINPRFNAWARVYLFFL